MNKLYYFLAVWKKKKNSFGLQSKIKITIFHFLNWKKNTYKSVKPTVSGMKCLNYSVINDIKYILKYHTFYTLSRSSHIKMKLFQFPVYYTRIIYT